MATKRISTKPAKTITAFSASASSPTHYNSNYPKYDGAELRRNPGIPAERFAAFDLPSRIAGALVYPRKPQ